MSISGRSHRALQNGISRLSSHVPTRSARSARCTPSSIRGCTMSEPKQATAFAPASTSNLAVGFDLLGHALEEPGDRITVRRIPRPEVRIERILGCTTELPLDPTTNTASVGLISMIDDLGLDFGFELEISKGIPLGSGIGGSAASAVAAVTAANALLPMPLDESELFHYALVAAMIASGAAHGDNLAPALFGGLVLVRGLEPLEIVRVPVPEPWRCTIVRPHLRIDTRRAREVLPRSEEHTSELHSRGHLVCLLLLQKNIRIMLF